MPNNERISQLKGTVSEALKRIDQTLAELRQSELRQSDARQQVLMQQTETNSAIMRRLESHESRFGDLEKPGPGQAA